MVVSSITRESSDGTKITLSLSENGEYLSPPEYSPEVTHSVEDEGEEILFSYQSGSHFHIVSDTEDWEKFWATEHAGELVSLSIDVGTDRDT